MDETDLKLLELADHGTTKYSLLARKLDMPLSTVHSRMKRMELDRVIRGYRADIDWKRAGLNITAFVLIKADVGKLRETGKTQDSLLEELLETPYIDQGYVITGEADILIRITARDSGHLKDILLRDIDSMDGITGTRTIIVLG
ncbi:MAG: Lrp/AsnC family transcriptional regulator [Candidatus Thermoplasmatota archaeon]|jgi:DNA-binding Lrp family transcriptional regulator|nr:Lrp/AsnC family transcriptional regulator [Candidatus Thermoplasmatota archaeon]MCL5955684.1 Lrp/AsnC family transcriptional regulator [Candidatus Thermoplasmatota archaeon]